MKLFLVKGYDSFNQKEVSKVFKTILQANNYSIGLTDPKTYMMSGKDYITIFNKIL